MPLYYKSCPFIKLDKLTSESDAKVDEPIDKVELTLLFPLYCKTRPGYKVVKLTSVSPDSVDVKLKFKLTHFPLIYCNIWFAVGEIILSHLKKNYLLMYSPIPLQKYYNILFDCYSVILLKNYII